GGQGADSLYGDAGNDRIEGGVGDDIIVGGAGQDTMAGGEGIDTFVFAQGDGAVTSGAFDVITDWENGDLIDVGGLVGGYVELGAQANETFDEMITRVRTEMSGGDDIVAVQYGNNVVVFFDMDGNGTEDTAVVLQGRTLDFVDSTN